MTTTKEKPPEINPMLKLSIGSVISNPIPDQEYLTTKGKKNLYLTTFLIIIDIILTILIFLQEYDFLTHNFKNNFLPFSIKSLLCILILVSIILIFWSHEYILVKITRFVYIILGTIYYFFKFILKLVNLINDINNEYEPDQNNLEIVDIIFLFVHLTTIIPRIFTFFISKGYVEKLGKIRKLKMEEEHESFVEQIANRLEKGYNRWSNPNENYIMENDNENDNESEQNKKHIFDKNENDDNKNNENNENNDENIVLTINGNKADEETNNNNYIFDKKEEEFI